MPTESIDLTGSNSPSPPTPPPRSFNNAPKILDFGSGSVVPCLPNNMNPANYLHYYANPQQAAAAMWSPASGSAYQYSQAVAMFPPNMQGGQVAIVLEPVPAAADSRVLSFPNPTRVEETTWTSREHQLFLMGLVKYGKGRWAKITENFLWNKTPQQVQSYAANFFKHVPNASSLYSFWRRNLAYSASGIMIGNNNNLLGTPSAAAAAAPNNSLPMLVNNNNVPKEAQKTTLSLFPEKAGISNNTTVATTSTYGYDDGASSSSSSMITTGSGNGEVDLELRLGYN